ncbi:MAG: DUF2147 domain-containing protein [Bacteroidales bacterium]|nr:DUF2147 domain-containing protein [Bacteroidales bacterium]
MKKLLMTLVITMFTFGGAMAQNALNNAADNVVGVYEGSQNGDKFKAKIVKLTNGTYRGQVIWMQNPNDANGKKRLDKKNPDEKLRNTPCDQIVLFSGLEYNAKKKRWDGTKIYDPQRGMRANLTVEFDKDGRLKLRGSILGIGETVYWTKVKEK